MTSHGGAIPDTTVAIWSSASAPRLNHSSKPPAHHPHRVSLPGNPAAAVISRSRMLPRRGEKRLSKVWIAAGVWAAVWPALARAEAGTVEIAWSAPADCPTTPDVEASVRDLLGRPPHLPDGRKLEVKARAERKHDCGWSGTIETRLGTTTGSRTIATESCRAVADATALIVALMIDPDAVAARASPPATPSPPQDPAPDITRAARRNRHGCVTRATATSSGPCAEALAGPDDCGRRRDVAAAQLRRGSEGRRQSRSLRARARGPRVDVGARNDRRHRAAGGRKLSFLVCVAIGLSRLRGAAIRPGSVCGD